MKISTFPIISNNKITKYIEIKLLIISLLIALMTGLLIITSLETVLNTSSYYVYYGTTGPFNVENTESNDPKLMKLGEKNSIFKPGDYVGWTSDINIESGIATISSIILYDITSNKYISVDEFKMMASGKRTGKKDFFFKLPIDLEAGNYELRRKLVFYPNKSVPIAQGFTSIPFEVK